MKKSKNDLELLKQQLSGFPLSNNNLSSINTELFAPQLEIIDKILYLRSNITRERQKKAFVTTDGLVLNKTDSIFKLCYKKHCLNLQLNSNIFNLFKNVTDF